MGEYDFIAITASAGGISALAHVLSSLPADFDVPIVVVQHHTPGRTPDLAHVLSRLSRRPVRIAEAGQRIMPGTVYLAPGSAHLIVRLDQSFELMDGRRIAYVRSSAESLFSSAADAYGPRMIAVVLTGLGRNRAGGVRRVKDAGGTVIAQDEATSRYFSMPQAALATGAVDSVLPLGGIAPELIHLTAKAA
ncbi:MAG TPA: chemotaxis protein CheB [Gemmatimonadaceae bacterium]|nr:chemotaxis protein CheB [Gemmatimonadaceae bacterium]